jgi:geranylgeranyl diphosphate synthase type I
MMRTAEASSALIKAKFAFLSSIENPVLRDQLAFVVHGAAENKQWGSQSRGLIVLLFSGQRERAIKDAVSIELMHNAALIVDDLIDQTKMRRGNPSFWMRYGAEATILVAHIVISRAFGELGKFVDQYPGLIDLILSDIAVMAEAELRAGRREVHTGREYLAYAHAKTGRLFERAAALGLGSNCQFDLLIRGIGRVGLLHQIVDDAKDQTVDQISQSVFGQCNWTRLSKSERMVVLNEISVIQGVDWPYLQETVRNFKNGNAIIEVLQEIGQLPDPLRVLSLAG